METNGSRLLGASYKNPLESFELFRRFSVEHPEVSIDVECWKNGIFVEALVWSNLTYFSGLLVTRY